MGFSDFGFLGSEFPTPNIDHIAAQGTTYTQFYVYPRCSPTRAALLTGQYPHQVGMGFLALPDDINAPSGPYQGYLSPETLTLADDLKSAGYKTYMSGKWHLGDASEHWPLHYGFDRYFGLISGASSFYELLQQRDGRVRKMAKDNQPWFPPSDNFYMTDSFTDQALSYVNSHFEEHSDKPFFLYLAYTAPHFPLHARETDIDAFDGLYGAGWVKAAKDRYSKLSAIGITGTNNPEYSRREPTWSDKAEETQWMRNMKVYAAMMKSADDGVGRLMHELERQNAMDNTIIFVFSDNGASAEDVSSRGLNNPETETGHKGSYVAYGPNGASLSNMPFRDFKGTTYEGGIRSPLIVHGGDMNAGVFDHETVISVTDIRQAISDKIMSGDQSAPVFRKNEEFKSIYWEHLGWRGVRSNKWKAVSRPNRSAWELYNILKDPLRNSKHRRIKSRNCSQN